MLMLMLMLTWVGIICRSTREREGVCVYTMCSASASRDDHFLDGGTTVPFYEPFTLSGTREGTRICETVPSAPRRPSDRSRTCVPMVWIVTKYTNTHRPTARRRARSLGLGTPLAGNLFDVSREDLTSSRFLLLLIADELPVKRAAQDTIRIAY